MGAFHRSDWLSLAQAVGGMLSVAAAYLVARMQLSSGKAEAAVKNAGDSLTTAVLADGIASDALAVLMDFIRRLESKAADHIESCRSAHMNFSVVLGAVDAMLTRTMSPQLAAAVMALRQDVAFVARQVQTMIDDPGGLRLQMHHEAVHKMLVRIQRAARWTGEALDRARIEYEGCIGGSAVANPSRKTSQP